MKTKIKTIGDNIRHVCLYPTFKEWKLSLFIAPVAGLSVYILPLRNENQDVQQQEKSLAQFISYL